MPGALFTLFNNLQNSQFFQSNNVTLVFGDEESNAQRYPLPLVIMTPRGGRFEMPGYSRSPDPSLGTVDIDPYTEQLWDETETIDFILWNASSDQQGAIDHADAIESLKLIVLSALQDQKAQTDPDSGVVYRGLQFKNPTGEWKTFANAVSRYGRAYVLSVPIIKPVVMLSPPQAEIDTTSLTFIVTRAPG
jgi:hypothetical protein